MARQTSQPPPEPRAGPRELLRRLPGVFAYPLRGRGAYLILACGIVFALLRLGGAVLEMIPYGGILTMLATTVLGCLFPAYMLETIGRSASGDSAPPDWPDISSIQTDLIRPALLTLGTAAVSYLPASAYWIAHWCGWIDSPHLAWGLTLAAGLYFPMALLAVCLFDGMQGVSPRIVLPAIVRTGPAYLIACAVLGGVAVVGWLAVRHSVIPILGLDAFVGTAVGMYFLMAESRLLGLIYYLYEDRLGWFTVPPPAPPEDGRTERTAHPETRREANP